MKQTIILMYALSFMMSCSTSPDSDFLRSNACDYSPCLGEAEYGIADLPAEISAYVTANYADAMIEEAEVLGCNIVETENENESEGENENEHEDLFTGSVNDIDYYTVELSNGTELLFDDIGNFVASQVEENDGEENDENDGDLNEDDNAEDGTANDDDNDDDDMDDDDSDDDDSEDGDDDDDDTEDDDMDDDEVNIELPANATSYLSTNYGSYTIEDIDTDTEFGYRYFSVELEDEAADSELEVLFDADGNFLCASIED